MDSIEKEIFDIKNNTVESFVDIQINTKHIGQFVLRERERGREIVIKLYIYIFLK